ncbi:MAG: helix-turn-helix domain-containing protein [Anaerovoracaceae bacterium]
MEFIKSGELIAKARKDKNYTQKQVAELLNVSDKAVSKWETGAGCPDIGTVAGLAKLLEIDEKTLLSGIAESKDKDNGNLKKTKFYVCSNCGNVLTGTSEADISCCGMKLQCLNCDPKDCSHEILIETIDGDYYITVKDHPMTKSHYISFMCFVTGDKMHLTKLYPEQSAEARFAKQGHGFIYVYCNNHGLYKKLL